jgi:Predicted site-specific integrase-resolvase
MIRRIAVGDVKEIVMEHADRLTRFGFEYFVDYCKTYNVAIVVLEKAESKAFEQELAEDMLTLVTSYSARYYGRRGGRSRKAGNLLLKTLRVRLRPTQEQEKLFHSFVGCSKFVYNYVLRKQKEKVRYFVNQTTRRNWNLK